MDRARITDGLILVAIVGIALWIVLSKQSSDAGGMVGEPAPQFRLKTMSGAVTGTADHGGKVVLLDFWATWCDPCFKQMPAIQTLMKENPDLVVLPINVDDPGDGRLAAMKKFLAAADIDADSLVDDGSVKALYRVDTIPALFVIDRDGEVAYASVGVHTVDDLRKRVEKVEGSEP